MGDTKPRRKRPETRDELDQVAIECAASLGIIGLNGAQVARQLANDHREFDDEQTAAGLDELAEQLQAIGDQCVLTWRELGAKGGKVSQPALRQLVAILSRPR